MAGNKLKNVGSVSCGKLSTGSILNMAIGASVVIKAKSGRFLCGTGSGYLIIPTASLTDIMGWVVGTFEATSSSTAGGTSWDIETDLSKLFVMPACDDSAGAVTEAELLGAIGYTMDIQMVSTSYQYCDLGASAIDLLLGYGYIYEGSAAGQQYMIVKVTPKGQVYTTHSDV